MLRINKTLLFISIIFVSLIAVCSVSAADDVADVVAVSDVDDSEVIAVDNEAEAVGADDSDIIAADEEVETVGAGECDVLAKADEAEALSADADEADVLKGSTSFSFGNGSSFDISSLFNGSSFSFGNGTSFDISSLMNGTTISFGNGTTMNLSSFLNGTTISFGNGTSFGNGSTLSFGNGTSMSFGNGTTLDFSSLLNGTSFGNGTSFNFGNGSGFNLDSILDIFGGNTKEDTIEGTDLTQYYTKNTKFKVTVKNGNQTLTSGTVVFTINNQEYTGHIGSDGVASVSLKTLKPGTYYITAEYGKAIVKHCITIKKSVITKNVSKKYKKAGKFTVKILNSKGKPYAKQTVKVKFKGKTHTIKTNSKGIATLKLSKKLKVGKYTIKTTYAGLTLSNKITVKK